MFTVYHSFNPTKDSLFFFHYSLLWVIRNKWLLAPSNRMGLQYALYATTIWFPEGAIKETDHVYLRNVQDPPYIRAGVGLALDNE